MKTDVTDSMNISLHGCTIKSIIADDENNTFTVTYERKLLPHFSVPESVGKAATTNRFNEPIKKRCYLSGKVSGLTTSEYTANFQYAANAAEKMGYTSVNPVAIHGQKKWCWLRFMVADIRLLLPCEAIYLQRNWRDSKGSKVERFFAKCLQKTIIYQ